MLLDERTDRTMREIVHLCDSMRKLISKITGDVEESREYLTTQEVAARMKCDEQAVLRMVRAGCPHYTYTKGYTFIWSEVETFNYLHHRQSGSLERWSGAKKGAA